MAENSLISWTDHTFNPWMGCSKVSAGCANCYAEELMQNRYKKVIWGGNGTRVRTSPANWKKPLRWNKEKWYECSECELRMPEKDVIPAWEHKLCPICDEILKPTRQRVFCASLADVFEDREELFEWRKDLLALIDKTPNLDWLILTKRPENVNSMLEEATHGILSAREVLAHMPQIWIGTSAENQEQADIRLPHLLDIPAQNHLLSIEPLLGAIDLHFPKRPNPNNDLWVIVGGESGKNARPMHPDWVRSLRDQCADAGVPFFFKQWGEWMPISQSKYAIEGETMVTKQGAWQRLGKKAAGCLINGEKVQQFPDFSRGEL